MRKIVYFFITILVVSCDPFGQENAMGYESPRLDLDTAWRMTASKGFIFEGEYSDYWKSPIEFEADGAGDCDDFCIYLMYLLGPEAKMVVYYTGRTTMKRFYHAVVYYNGKFIEPQVYGKYLDIMDMEDMCWYDWNYTMWKATAGGSKGVR